MPFTPTNPLCSLTDVKAALRLFDTTDDDRLNLCIDAASRMIERAYERQFHQDAAATQRVFTPDTPFTCPVDDFMDTADLVVETFPNGLGNPSVVWATTDYQLEPLNGIRDGQPWPYERIRAVASQLFPVYGGLAYPVPFVQALVRVTTKWGWSAVPTDANKAGILQTIALFKADDVPFGATPFGESGIVRLRSALHPTVQALMAPFDRETVQVA